MQVNYPHLLPINISKSSWIKFLQIKKYFKKNNESDESDPRTIIVTNLSPSCTKEDIFDIFKSFGNIENIVYVLLINIVLLNYLHFYNTFSLGIKESNTQSNKSVNNNNNNNNVC